MTNETADPANADAGAGTHEQPVCEGNDPLASVPLHWAQTRGIRKRNPNGCIGLPSADFATEWAKAARLSDIRTSDELCAVLDHALQPGKRDLKQERHGLGVVELSHFPG